MRHKAHVARLEQIMRLLDNEARRPPALGRQPRLAVVAPQGRGRCAAQALNPEEIEEVREMVDDYLERHEDAFDEFDNPDDIYSDLVEQLDGLEVRRPARAAPGAPPTRLDES
jgi:CCR4-NOT transcription complex subunit 3